MESAIAVYICLDQVASFTWDEERGNRLRKIREAAGFSRKGLSLKTKASQLKPVTVQYIQQLEVPHQYIGRSKKASSLTVSKEIIESLCIALDIEIGELMSAVKIPSPTP